MSKYHVNSRTESKQSLKRALDLNLSPQMAPEAKRILDELE